jgi:L-2-hydroxyglutarate oxidase
LAEIFTTQQQGVIYCNHKVNDVLKYPEYSEVITNAGTFKTKLIINTAGLFSDRIAALSGNYPEVQIIPFRGEYYQLKPEKASMVRNLIYPVPNPSFPFLGVHFTRHIDGSVEAGPNAVWAFKREGYTKTSFSAFDTIEALLWPGFRKVIKKYWKEGWEEYKRSLSKRKFTLALQQLVPNITEADLIKGDAGVRAQACDRAGNLIDDFVISESEGMLNVLNAPSPAATACLSVAKTISNRALLFV